MEWLQEATHYMKPILVHISLPFSEEDQLFHWGDRLVNVKYISKEFTYTESLREGEAICFLDPEALSVWIQIKKRKIFLKKEYAWL